jgi:hypothetical protein
MATKTQGSAKKTSGSAKVAIGAGIAAAVAAAAAGAYMLYGKQGAKNRQKIKGWALKAKGEVLDQMERMEHVTKDSYEGIVNNVMAQYKTIKNIDQKDLIALAGQLKGMWSHIQKHAAPKKKSAKKSKKSTS